MLENEDKIVAEAIKGKAEAFGFLYDHYQPKIYRFTFLKVSRREEAEDITHQVFLRAWQNIKDYRNLGLPFSSWLYQIARNQIIDYYRSFKNLQRLDFLDPEALPVVSAVESDIDRRLLLGQVMTRLQELKPDYQDVLIMRFVDDLSLKETAEALGKSEGAIKIIQHRAVEQLKKILAAD